MNDKIVKFIVKGSISLGTAALIGYMIKQERKLEERVDEHYENKNV